LHYSVNGEEEKTLPLYQSGQPLKTVTAGHTFYLEELNLKVGDVISYYAKASDGNPQMNAQKATSDMYFIEVSSFDKAYSQSQEKGQGGGQGGGSAGALTRQQKDIIAATWRLIREQSRMEKREFSESVRSVALVQAKLREQTAGLAATIGSR